MRRDHGIILDLHKGYLNRKLLHNIFHYPMTFIPSHNGMGQEDHPNWGTLDKTVYFSIDSTVEQNSVDRMSDEDLIE